MFWSMKPQKQSVSSGNINSFKTKYLTYLKIKQPLEYYFKNEERQEL